MTAEVCGDTSTGRRTLTLYKVLIDTGAIHYNYMSTECVRLHKFKRFNLIKAINVQSIHIVETSNQCVYIDTVLKYKDDRIEMVKTQFIILDKSPYDIIIGLETIRNYDLTTKLKTYSQAQENV